jgi:hypothetical protein
MRQVMVSRLKAFQKCQKNIDEHNDEAPAVTELDLIGSFRLIDDSREH